MSDVKTVVSELLSDTLDVYRNYIYSPSGRPYPRRRVFNVLRSMIDKGTPLILLYGLRGTGKTFLLYQLLDYYRRKGVDVYYVPVDRLYRRTGDAKAAIYGIFDYLGYKPHEVERKTVVLLDEVHVVSGWDGWLKDIYDASHFNRNLGIVATGSSSISILMSSDLLRRAVMVELPPLFFPEYIEIKFDGRSPPADVLENLGRELFLGDPKPLYESARKFLLDLGSPTRIFQDYLTTGGFPIFKRYSEGPAYFELLEGLVRKIITDDIVRAVELESSTLAVIPEVLSFLAESVGSPVSFDKISARVGISKSTVRKVISALVDSALLIEVKRCGKSASLREPRKYYFSHASLIPAVLGYRSRASARKLMPQLLENAVASFLHHSNRVGKICYTLSADFYAEGFGGGILVEVGVGKRRRDQFRKSGVGAKRCVLAVEDDVYERENNFLRIPAYLLGFI